MQQSVSQATSSPQHDSSNPQEHVTHTVEQPSVSQATSSLKDMQINPQGSGVTSRKPTIEDISAPDSDTVGQLLQEQKYDEAYGVSRTQIKLDPAVIGSKDLVNHYRCCMLVEETEEAIRIKDKLKHLLKDKFQTTPDEIKTFADTIMGEERDMEAILFYQIAAEFYGNQSLAGLVGITNCACGIQEAIEVMLSRDEGLKPIARTHVIPLMRHMRKMIQRSYDVSKEDQCLREVWCLHYIGWSERLVGEERAWKKAIDVMEKGFNKERAEKYLLYGICLYNLGDTYEDTSRPNDACQCYHKAIAAIGKAKDSNDKERDNWIGLCKQGLNNCERKME
ncbi:uncharacterized protein LOC144743499 [Ciona intestinalis]